MMRLRTVGIIFSLVLGILSAPLASDAQPPAKVLRIGYMSPGDVPPYDNAFLQGLQDQGYILPGEIPRYDAASWQGLLKQGYFEGKKIRIEIRATDGRFERAPELAAELVGLNVNVIYATPSLLVKAAQEAVRKANKPIPIVFAPEFDPVGFGLVTSLARPGGNTTGLASLTRSSTRSCWRSSRRHFPGSPAWLTLRIQPGIRITFCGPSRRWRPQPGR